jgi:hypothetical protein
MANALVFDVPVKLGLEFVPIVRPHLPDAEREALDDVVEEIDGVGLGVPAVDLEGPGGRSVVDGGVLVAFDRLSVFFPEDQELDVNLYLMARNLLLVAGGMDLAEPRTSWEPVQAIALEDTGYAGRGVLQWQVSRMPRQPTD